MRIEDPAVLKTGLLSVTSEREDALDGHVGFDGDTELHGDPSSLPEITLRSPRV
jgi:hypothetical protein